jgi:hypothetical protein
MKVIYNHKEFEQIDEELEYIKNHVIYVGFLSEKIIDGVNVQVISIWNEYGTIYIPSRPFFRTATQTRKAQREIEEYIEKQIQLILELKKTGKQVMDSIGLYVVGRIQLSIKKGKWQRNAESTIARKGKNNPLIDTGTMISSVSYEIRSK